MKRREMLVTTGTALVGMSMRPFAAYAQSNAQGGGKKIFRAGAYAQDITPEYFPITVNGSFKPHYAKSALDPLHARCLVLDDSLGQIAMAVVDSCMLDRELLEEAKQIASRLTGIPTGRIFISATHTHSAPAAVSVLGTDYEPRYRAWLPGKIAEGIHKASNALVPAQVGWAVESLPEVAQSRRWITRPDRIKEDPFGEFTTRATMHPGHRNPDWEEPSGPMNPEVSVLAVRRPDGSPIALLGSFSIHYVGSSALSADYFGIFAERVADLLKAGGEGQPFVGILANGVSGDAYLKNYTLEKQDKFDKHSIAEVVAQAACKAYRAAAWSDWLPLDVRESELELKLREPKIKWAKKFMAEIEAGREKVDSRSGTYAREQFLLAEMPNTVRIKLQALRIGKLAIVGIPCEVFAITGLRIADASPFEHTFTVMLANGYNGYLPPPEQMVMGGYTTWLARSSYLETEAEPKIVAEVGKLLTGLVGGMAIKRVPIPVTRYAAAVMSSKPLVYWRLDELAGPHALNAVDGRPLGKFGMPTAYHMPGAQAQDFPGLGACNRVPHFVGTPLSAAVAGLGSSYSIELWFYNCMPSDARAVTGYLFARGDGDRLAIGGTAQAPGRLVFHVGDDLGQALSGKSDVPLRNWVDRESWHHMAFVRNGQTVKVYLDGKPEMVAETAVPDAAPDLWIGGKGDGELGFEGRMDEVAVFGRVLGAEEISRHYHAAL
ncbi:MAG: LamG-like jellyroll fold domain-containing protein [Kiritimatiellia bacterium]